MGCSSIFIDSLKQHANQEIGISFVQSNIQVNPDLQLNDLPAPVFENIKLQEIVVTSQQSKLLQIVGKLKNKIDINKYYLVKASLLQFSDVSVMPQMPLRMQNFVQEMEEKNIRLQQQIESDQDIMFYQNLHHENRKIKTRGAARQSMQSNDDPIEGMNIQQQVEVEMKSKYQQDEVLTAGQENIKMQLEKQKEEYEQQFADLDKLDQIENPNLFQRNTQLNEKVQKYFKVGQYICDPVDNEQELYSEEIKEHRFINKSNVQYVKEIVAAKLIELVASGAKSGEVRIGCSQGYQIIWDIQDSAIALAEIASNSEITASRSGSSSICGSSTQLWAIIKCSEIISDVDPQFVEVESRIPGIEDQTGITYDRLMFNRNALIKFVPHCYRHFTSLLNTEELAALQQIVYSLELMKSKVNLLEPVPKQSWDKIWKCIIYDFPELFYSVSTPFYSNDAGYVYKLSLNYNESVDSILEKQDRLNTVTQSIISPILQNIQSLSQFDIELIICDYLVHNISYDLKSPHNQQVEGGLLDKRCVCAGYSRSFQYLAQHINLPSLYVSGWAKKPNQSQGEGHAWNKLFLNQNWYGLDVTWTSESDAGYCYFNFNDKYAGRSRKEDSDHIYPACTLMDQFYYVHNKTYVNQQNINQIQLLTCDYAIQQIQNNTIDFTIVIFIDFQTKLFDFSQELEFGMAKAASRCNVTIKDSQVSSSGDNALILKVSLNCFKFQEFEEIIPNFAQYCFSSSVKQRNILRFNKKALIQFKPETFRYHVDLLTERELASLQDIIKCLEIGVSTVNLLQFCSKEEMERIHHCLEYDFTEYIYSLSYSLYCKDGNIYKIQFSVLPDPDQIQLEQQQLEKAIYPLVEQVRSNQLNEMEAEILIAQWIANNISKSNSKSSSFSETAYGIFVDKSYSWLGIHEAFTYAMQCLGISCITVSNAKGYYNLVFINNDWRTVKINDQLYNPFELNTIDKLNSIYVLKTLFRYPQTQSLSVNHAKMLNILISSETEPQLCQIITKVLTQQILKNKGSFLQYIFFDYKAQLNSLCQIAWVAISSVKNSFPIMNISLSTGVDCFIFQVQ